MTRAELNISLGECAIAACRNISEAGLNGRTIRIALAKRGECIPQNIVL